MAVVVLVGALIGPVGAAAAAPEQPGSAAEYWTQARMDAAIPRDLVIDERGQGYLRRPDGTLAPYGQEPSTAARPQAKPDNPGNGNGGGNGGGNDGGGGGGSTDTTGPVVSDIDPGVGQEVTASSHDFAATITDDSGLKSVTFVVTGPDETATSYVAATLDGDTSGATWGATVSGLSDGEWSWHVEARDGAKRGGNTTVTEPVTFTVDLPDDGGDTDQIVTNAVWDGGGTVQTAAGRIYFKMPSNGPNWGGYVCSGTVATDGETGRSVVITAAHCVYDDVNKVFARNVLFIPNQAGTTGSGTNTSCTDDPLGCWEPTHGVVDLNWANQTWPDNIPWDYAYYVVPDEGVHTGGVNSTSEVLDEAAGSLSVQFTTPAVQGDQTHALGYSYSEDPNFMYCAEGLGTDGDALWLGSCGLSGGASGGPWLQPVANGDGPIVSVNSYGYSDQPGMGAPDLTGSASCVFAEAKDGFITGERGTVVDCP